MALFTIGNFVTKLLVMLLVPLYTNVLTTAEYGVADGMQTTLLLLVPLLTVNIGEAALRYGIARADSRGNVLHILVKITMLSNLVVTALCFVGFFVIRLMEELLPVSPGGSMHPGLYFIYFALLFLADSLYEGMVLFCQGCEKVKVMVTGSIVCTLTVICSNIILLLVVKAGLEGYLISQILSYVLAFAVMMILASADKSVKDTGKTDEALQSEMLDYGRGMLLYSTSSWANNAIDRYFVLAMCGAAANGLYAVAYKIPAILTVFQRIFAQAWQISANKSYEDEDATLFFSRVYEGYQAIMTTGCAFLIMVVKPVAGLLFAKEFYNAWNLVPPLLISVIFGALTGFLGSICLAYKDGKSMGRATGIGALVNIVLNFILIKQIGAMGAAIATMVSYYIMFFFSFRAASRHVELKVNTVRDMVAYLFLSLEFLFVSAQLKYDIYVSALCFIIIGGMYVKRLREAVMERLGREVK